MANCALILKISLAMLAFAANSILCRLALQGGHIDPLSFSSLRLASGALVLSPFLFYHAKTTLSLWRPLSGFYLMVYAVLFSVAYIHLDTGAGALLLFGAVQFAMVIHGLFKGESLSVMRACGLVIALAGIAALLLPGAKAPPLYNALMMIVAGLAWAAYSVRGRAGQAAGASTAANYKKPNFIPGPGLPGPPIRGGGGGGPGGRGFNGGKFCTRHADGSRSFVAVYEAGSL
ncbi:EamA family transporter [Klebsiella pneumoniae]|nr:EamA family transporter [Klebsiella pneumoniae]